MGVPLGQEDFFGKESVIKETRVFFFCEAFLINLFLKGFKEKVSCNLSSHRTIFLF